MIELAVDNTVTTLPVGNLNDIASMARRFADQVEAGEYSKPNRAIVIVERDDGLTILSWGQGLSAYELMGILEAAKLNVFAEDLADDE